MDQSSKWLANPTPGEDVIISGISGQFPESNNLREFSQHLFQKKDLITGDKRRWQPIHPEIPQRTGKINNLNKFDNGYFGIHYRQAHNMDPLVRVFLEKSIEAIMDAGLNPSQLEGTKTAVFVGSCFSESEHKTYFRNFQTQTFSVTGCVRSMIPNRVSYYLKLKGPSYIVDTACSSSLYALEHAFKAIRTGQCDYAIVGGSHLCLHPITSLQFARLGVLSTDGCCKVFDNAANGYVRSEAIACVFLQKSINAKRVYAKVVHAKTNCDGYKSQGITFPSSQDQKQLLVDFYQDCQIPPWQLSYVEAHGTGTQVGDPEEVLAIDGAFTHNRQTPLLIGSVKSNIGHTEPSAGICSIAKCVIAMETGYVPPNINFSEPKKGLEGLEMGRLQVVTEKQPLDGNGLIGVNSFGFGGANCHILLQWNKKVKCNGGLPIDDLPRLVCVSGRTLDGITAILDDVNSRVLDAEYVWLLQQLFSKHFMAHHYRGYAILNKNGELKRSFRQCFEVKPRLVFTINHLENWQQMALPLMKFPVFSEYFNIIHDILMGLNVNLKDILAGKQSNFGSILGPIAVQICLLHVLKLLEITPDVVVGQTIGQLLCAFLDDCLTLEQTLLLAYELNLGEPNILKKFQTIVTTNPKVKTTKWPTTTNGNLVTAEFLLSEITDHTNQKLPENTLVLNIGGGGDSTTEKSPNLSLGTVNSAISFLELIGSLYENGFNPQIQNLYPTIERVSRGTPMIAPLIRWNHENNWRVSTFKQKQSVNVGEKFADITIKDPNWTFVAGHLIDGRNLFPATGYLSLVWDTLAISIERKPTDFPVIFENCKFHRATVVPSDGSVLELVVMVQRNSGHFEITEGGNTVVTGRIFIPEHINFSQTPAIQENGVNLKMTAKDIYKELRLRGYNYKGAFRGLLKCNLSATLGEIKWDGNWVSFMDNMLQMKILQVDTRLLYVPTSIRRLSIDPKKQLNAIEDMGKEEPTFPIYLNKESDTIKAGAVEIQGLLANSIAHRKMTAQPVLERYTFVANVTTLTLEQSLRVNLQLILENTLEYCVKAIELVTDENQTPLSPLIADILDDLPLIQSDLTIFTKLPLDTTIKMEDKKLLSETDCLLVIGRKILHTPIMQQAFAALSQNGFILSREDLTDKRWQEMTTTNIDIITVHTTETEQFVLFRKKRELSSKKMTVIDIGDIDNFKWLPHLQMASKTNEEILIFAQNQPLNGILGLVNCLRREPGGTKFKCYFILDDTTPEFNLVELFYQRQLSMDLAVNVYKHGEWGTYRHLLLPNATMTFSEHCFVNSLTRGDLSSLTWLQGPLSHTSTMDSNNNVLVDISYAALNFRDVMTASGRINADVITMDRLEQECVQGFEFAGYDVNGSRVMGMVPTKALATLVVADRNLLIPIPDNWSLEEAATVPVVYGTVIYSLLVKAHLAHGQSILIHSGSGGIGLAAITLCLHYNCTVFTTVGSEEKRDFLLQHFPQLKRSHIGNSRDTSFEQLIKKQTNGRGVDIVLNSLAEEKLLASIRCLAQGGTFLEIGKFDLANNNQLGLLLLEKDANFHGCMLDRFFYASADQKRVLVDCISKAIASGAIKPLPRTIFQMNDVEKAFRYMATGKHIGKVLIAIRGDVHPTTTTTTQFPCWPRFTCHNKDNVYIIVGGLGGFGLELADWLILRGCRKLVLTSRVGIQNGYQAYRVKIWQSYGISIQIATNDITTKNGCLGLIETALKLGGDIEAIFNLAVVLSDGLLENQTIDSFHTSFKPKAYAVQHFDQVTRKLCPNLKYFVCFSSVSCGRGNGGQSNYGMANSVMERICEQRNIDNLPALAIQFGAIGGVGLVADMLEDNGGGGAEIEIGGTLQQRLTNCLQVLDKFLNETNTIVSSMVVAEKRTGGNRNTDDMIDVVANILEIRDLKTISLHATLAELGMDSMIAVEIKQTLEREFDVFLTPQDIRNMTFNRLYQIQTEKQLKMDEMTAAGNDSNNNIFTVIPTEGNCNTTVINLTSKQVTQLKLVVIPGIEGVAQSFEKLALNLDGHVIGLQYGYDKQNETIREMADNLIPFVEHNLTNGEFHILCYSFGAIVGLEIAAILEKKGLKGHLLIIDGAPDMIKDLTKTQLPSNDVLLQIELLCQLAATLIPIETLAGNRENMMKCPNFEERINFTQKLIPKEVMFSINFQKQIVLALYKRIKALFSYEPKYEAIQSPVKLYKPSQMSLIDYPDDYKLKELCKMLDIAIFEGNHTTILNNIDLANDINTVLKAKL